MRQIHYYIAMTLDGYIAHDDGRVDGFLMEGEHADEFVTSLERYDTVLMGRHTYEFGFQFGLQPGQPAYPGLVHYIFSETLKFEESEQVKLVKKDAVETLKTLVTSDGKDIWLCGGQQLATTLLAHDLIDKLIVKVNPIVFGTGKSLFGKEIDTRKLELVHQKTYVNGVVLLEYHISKNDR